MKMALANGITICWLVLSVNLLLGAADSFEVTSEHKADSSSLINGIPSSFPCSGPSKYLLEMANTKMLCGGKLCLVQCKPGHRSFKKIPFVYVCHRDGLWTTIPFDKENEGYSLDWPVCFSSNGF
eukprot:Seg2409.3 transcript_id=Seg2409.3/GoldUCD/mRNA.D3Y31 product="hypothetical protein" protein_id=Seg2409.3/GoldUCD/D3Y31